MSDVPAVKIRLVLPYDPKIQNIGSAVYNEFLGLVSATVRDYIAGVRFVYDRNVMTAADLYVIPSKAAECKKHFIPRWGQAIENARKHIQAEKIRERREARERAEKEERVVEVLGSAFARLWPPPFTVIELIMVVAIVFVTFSIVLRDCRTSVSVSVDSKPTQVEQFEFEQPKL